MNDKMKVAEYVADQVTEGMVIGLGTGSTADCFIEALAQRYQQGLDIKTVSSSVVSTIKAQESGLPMVAMEHLSRLDWYVDGADEVAPGNVLLKGQGADLVREKILAKACQQFIVLVDQSKLVTRIGERFAIPVEVVPFAWQMVRQQLELAGAKVQLRSNKQGNGLAISSHGSLILDVTFADGSSADEINQQLNTLPGIVEHGVFLGLADRVLLVKDGTVQEL